MSTILIGAGVKRQATTTLVLKTVINANLRALSDLLYSIFLTSARRTIPIDFATVIYFNCGKDGYFTSSCLELKDIGDIKEIEEEEIFNKLKKFFF